MNTQSKYPRRTFIKMMAAGSGAILLQACGIEESKEGHVSQQKATIDSTALREVATSSHVTYYTKDQAEYEILRHGHNKRFNKFPALIAVCHNTQGVQEAILLAKNQQLPIAIKSGGHSLEGFSVNEGGMVINLSKLNSIHLNPDNHVLTVGPACTLSELYATLIPLGRIIPGGSCGGVAVGGLTLGGGYGMFARQMGLTCDSLIEVSMVDGEGNTINSKDNPELLWACKGGGSGNYGVITEMKFNTHPAPKTLTSHRFRKFNTKATEAAIILEKWFEITATLPQSCFSVFVLNGHTAFILLTNTANETPEVQLAIEQFTSITEKVSLGKAQTLESAVQTFYGVQTPVFAKNSSVGLYKDFEDIRNFIVPTLEKISGTSGMLLSVGTLGGAIDNDELAKNSSFPHRKHHYLSELQTYWKKEEQGERLIKAYQEVRDIFQENGINREYINYPDIGFKNWESAYYGTNYERLQQVKIKYDPHNNIRHEQSIRLPSVG